MRGFPGGAHAIANQLQEPCVHNIPGRKGGGCAGRAIPNQQYAMICILVSVRIGHVRWMDTDKMARNACDECALGRYRPRFNMGFEEICVLLKVFCSRSSAHFTGKSGGADQRGNGPSDLQASLVAGFGRSGELPK